MSDIRIEVHAERINAALGEFNDAVQARLVIFMTAFTLRLMGQVKINIIQLFRSTAGRLYNSVGSSVTSLPGVVQGAVYTQGVPYARIQEEGGVTRPHVIVPRNVAVLRFEGPAGLVFAKRVNHPGSNIAGRPYARLALAQLRGEFEDGIRDVVSEARGTIWE